MINIKDTEYREKELTELLADTERKMGGKCVLYG